MLLILIVLPWLSAVLLVLAACQGASTGDAQLRGAPREFRVEHHQPRPSRLDVAGR
jgi:hypothetical protein